MTPEKLKYYTALQPLFREKMGPWKDYDTAIVDGKEIRWIQNSNAAVYVLNAEKEGRCIRVPLSIDPVSPERGLWGMVNWDLFSSLTPNPERGEWYIFGMRDRKTEGFKSEWQTPTLALLKALAVQEVKP